MLDGDDQLLDESGGEAESLNSKEIEQLLRLDQSMPASAAEDITRELDAETSEKLERAARGLTFIQRVQDENPHLVDDLTAAAESKWLQMEGERPTRIGRHVIKRRLGSGGFGVVFLAFDPELEREVALKVPRVETLINGQTRRRFLRESKTAAKLNHTNIATIFEAGTVGPIFYIAAEYCPGGSLDDFLRDEALPDRLTPASAAHLIAALADAIDHAHRRGILHRDIKPSNILLDLPQAERASLVGNPQRWGETAKLVDFGLAKNVSTSEDDTKSGVMLGTPAYTAPEMVLNRPDAGAAADIFSLGATLYHALTGQAPHKRATDFETLLAAQKDDALPPSRIDPTIPRDLDAICLKCLEKSPERRYATAAELAHDLQQFLSGKPIRARQASRLEKSYRWCHRNPLLSLLAAATLMLFLIAGCTTIGLWRMYRNQTNFSAELEIRRDAMNIRRLVDQARTTASLISVAGTDPQRSIRHGGLFEDGGKLLIADSTRGWVWDLDPFNKLSEFPLTTPLVTVGPAHTVLAVEEVTDEQLQVDQFDFQDAGSRRPLFTWKPTVESVARPPHAAWQLSPDTFAARAGVVALQVSEHGLIATSRMSGESVFELSMERPLKALALAGNGKFLAVADDQEVRILQTDTWQIIREFPAADPQRLYFCEDGRWLLVREPNQWRMFSRPEFVERHHWAASQAPPVAAFAGDDGYVVFATAANELQVVRIGEQGSAATLSIPRDETLTIVGSTADGHSVIAMATNGNGYTWNLFWLDEHLAPLIGNWRPITSYRP